MKNKSTIQTQQMMRRLFMASFTYAAATIPMSIICAFLGIVLWSQLWWALCGLFIVTGIVSGVIAGTWYHDHGVPMKMRLAKSPSKKEQENSDWQEFQAFKEQQDVRRLMAADANEIVYRDETYYRQRDWNQNEYYWESYDNKRLTLPKELG